jgi:hypothetical protein
VHNGRVKGGVRWVPRGAASRIAGPRTVPHTGVLRIEAWAATREECLAEAVRGCRRGCGPVTVRAA